MCGNITDPEGIPCMPRPSKPVAKPAVTKPVAEPVTAALLHLLPQGNYQLSPSFKISS